MLIWRLLASSGYSCRVINLDLRIKLCWSREERHKHQTGIQVTTGTKIFRTIQLPAGISLCMIIHLPRQKVWNWRSLRRGSREVRVFHDRFVRQQDSYLYIPCSNVNAAPWPPESLTKSSSTDSRHTAESNCTSPGGPISRKHAI